MLTIAFGDSTLTGGLLSPALVIPPVEMDGEFDARAVTENVTFGSAADNAVMVTGPGLLPSVTVGGHGAIVQRKSWRGCDGGRALRAHRESDLHSGNARTRAIGDLQHQRRRQTRPHRCALAVAAHDAHA